MKVPFLLRIASLISPAVHRYLQARVDDGDGWALWGGARWDNPQNLENQLDALKAWRISPMGRRIISLTTDYVVGDGISFKSPIPHLQGFIEEFWNYNGLNIRLPEICDELGRAGEIFPVLHYQVSGMSALRFVPAAEITRVETESEDYETELMFWQGEKPWYAKDHPNAVQSNAIMLHYPINKPIGATRGESDLAPILEWLKNYQTWLEDRVRLNWAARMWLWIVTVPAGKVQDKRSQYSVAPKPGSVVVKDDGEQWEMLTPSLDARDASADGKTLRYMIAAGAGVPLHMLGEAEGTNLATAQAQEDPTLRHYRRRQRYLSWALADIMLVAYNLSVTRKYPGRYRRRTHADIVPIYPDISRTDNALLASAARDIVEMLATLRNQLVAANIPITDELNRMTIGLALRFAGEALSPDEIDKIIGIEPA